MPGYYKAIKPAARCKREKQSTYHGEARLHCERRLNKRKKLDERIFQQEKTPQARGYFFGGERLTEKDLKVNKTQEIID